MLRRTVLTVLLGLAAAVPAGAAETTREIRAELPASQSNRFVIENLSGSMKVVPGKGPRVVAVATIHAESEELAQAFRFESVTTGRPHGEGDMPTLRVRYPLDDASTLRRPGHRYTTLLVVPKWLSCVATKVEYDGHHVAVSDHSGVLIYADVEVQVPAREIEAIFRNFFGKLDGSDLAGRITFDSHSGNVSIERARGRIVADTGSGDVLASQIEGTLRCDTGSGNCRIDGFQGEDLVCDTGSRIRGRGAETGTRGLVRGDRRPGKRRLPEPLHRRHSDRAPQGAGRLPAGRRRDPHPGGHRQRRSDARAGADQRRPSSVRRVW